MSSKHVYNLTVMTKHDTPLPLLSSSKAPLGIGRPVRSGPVWFDSTPPDPDPTGAVRCGRRGAL